MRPMFTPPTRFLVSLLPCILLVVPACTTNLKQANDAHTAGNFDVAAEEIATITPSDRDYLWYLLERGKMEQDAGRWAASIATYDRAIEIVESVDAQEARGSLEGASQSIQSLVAGENLADYRILRFQRVLLHANLAVSLMMSGDSRGAAVECRKVVDYQEQIKQQPGLDADRLSVEEADEAIMAKVPSGSANRFTAGSVFEDPDVRDENRKIAARISGDGRLAALDERVPWGHVVSWTAFMASGERAEARGTATEIEDLLGGSLLNTRIQALTNRGDLDDHVVILVDAGLGVVREEFTVTIPVPIPTIGVTAFVAPFPRLVFHDVSRPSEIIVKAEGRATETDLVDSIDGLYATDFKRRSADIYLPPVVRGASRAIGSAVAQAQTDNALAKLAIAGGTFAWGHVEEADLRTWSALPALQYAAIVPRPDSGELVLQTRGAGGQRAYRVALPPGPGIVYLRAVDSARGSAYSASLSEKGVNRDRGATSPAAPGSPDGSS